MSENNKPSVKAFVMKDGTVKSGDYLAAMKGESKQLPPDAFIAHYGPGMYVEPLYNLESLAKLMEENTYHYRAVKTKAKDTVGLGWSLQPNKGIKKARVTQKKPVEFFLNQMDFKDDLGTTLEKMMVDYGSTGNGYLEVVRHADGRIQALVHIPSHTVRRHATMNIYMQIIGGRKVYFKEIGNNDFEVHLTQGTTHPIGTLTDEEKANEIIHIYNYCSRSDYYGIPDVIPALGSLLADRERENFNLAFFENHAIPAYVVTVTGTELDEEAHSTIKRFFQEDVKDSRHSTLVLSAAKDPSDPSSDPIEFKFQALSTDVKEASFATFRKDNRDEILSAHGVPPYRCGIAETGSLGGTSAEEATKIYKSSIIEPMQTMIENILNKYVLWDESFGAYDWTFKFDEIDTADESHEIDMANKLMAMGALTPNEVRIKAGLEPIDSLEMNSYYLNGTLIYTPKPVVEEVVEEEAPVSEENA